MLYTGVLHKNEGFIFMISSMNAGMQRPHPLGISIVGSKLFTSNTASGPASGIH